MANTSSNDLRFAGDVNVGEITIKSLVNNSAFNVKNQLLTIQIYEDMFAPFITGSLIFRESSDFASNFPFVGEEVVDISIFTPSFDIKYPDNGVIKGRFYIYKMSDRQEVAERNTVYQLHFISVEAINDLNVKISKGFNGKISDIANELLSGENTLYTKKKVFIEETSNKTKYVSNFWSPIRNINYIVDHALNENESPTYVFYENRNGFNFISLDTLNSQRPFQTFQQYNVHQIITPDGGSARDINLDFRKITELTIPVSYDYMDKATSGVYGSTLLYSDLGTKEYFNQKFSLFDKWGDDTKETRLNKFPVASNKLFSTFRASMFNDTIEVGLFTDYEDVSNIKNRQKRISRLKQAEANKIQIVVYGRTDYTVGLVVKVVKFKSAPIEKNDTESSPEKILDGLISGNYLISAINHVIDVEKHECHMTLIKDSLIVDLNNVS